MRSTIQPWGIALLFSILSFSLHASAAAAEVIKGSDNVMIPLAGEHAVLTTSEEVAVEHTVTAAEPLMVNRDAEVLGMAVGNSAPAVELEKRASDDTVMIQLNGVATQQQPGQDTGLSLGDSHVVGGRVFADSVPAVKSADAGDPHVARVSADLASESVGNGQGLSTRQQDQDAKLLLVDAQPTREVAELQHVPTAVVLALIALIGVVPISRRGGARA